MLKNRLPIHRDANKTLVLLALSLTFALFVTPAVAQESTKTFGYFKNANTAAPDEQLTIVNPASLGGYSVFEPGGSAPFGDLCANIYVFGLDQQMFECCSCYVSPDGSRTLGVNVDLTARPSTPQLLQSGSIKIISSGLFSPVTACINASGVPIAASTYKPTGVLGAWIIHVNPAGNNLYSFTEASFFPAAIAANELTKVQKQCSAISASSVGGAGICTCGTGD